MCTNSDTIRLGFPTVVDPAPHEVMRLFEAVTGTPLPDGMLSRCGNTASGGYPVISGKGIIRWIAVGDAVYLTVQKEESHA